MLRLCKLELHALVVWGSNVARFQVHGHQRKYQSRVPARPEPDGDERPRRDVRDGSRREQNPRQDGEEAAREAPELLLVGGQDGDHLELRPLHADSMSLPRMGCLRRQGADSCGGCVVLRGGERSIWAAWVRADMPHTVQCDANCRFRCTAPRAVRPPRHGQKRRECVQGVRGKSLAA